MLDVEEAITLEEMFGRTVSPSGPFRKITNPKGYLQEKCQKMRFGIPQYELVWMIGQSHAPLFNVRVTIPELDIMAEAIENSKKKVEQAAAGLACAALPGAGC